MKRPLLPAESTRHYRTPVPRGLVITPTGYATTYGQPTKTSFIPAFTITRNRDGSYFTYSHLQFGKHHPSLRAARQFINQSN